MPVRRNAKNSKLFLFWRRLGADNRREFCDTMQISPGMLNAITTGYTRTGPARARVIVETSQKMFEDDDLRLDLWDLRPDIWPAPVEKQKPARRKQKSVK